MNTRKRLGASVSDDSGLVVAALADTPEDLDRLYRDKHLYWEWAAFASELVQRRNGMQRLVDAHHRDTPSHTNRRVMDIHELYGLYLDVLREIRHLAEELDRSMRSAPFQCLFGDKELYDDDPTPETIIAAASIVTDYYRANLLLARNTRGVVTRDDYVDVIKDMARLVDRPLECVDRWLTTLVGFIGVLPTLERNLDADTESHHSLVLDIDLDVDVRLKRIKRQLDCLRQPWRRWIWPW